MTTGITNFAQGSFAVFGSYFALTLFRIYGLHPYSSIPFVFIAGGVLGACVYVVILRPLIKRGATSVILMIATLALDLVLLGIIGAYSGVLGDITNKSAAKFIFTPLDYKILGTSGILVISTMVIAVLIFAASIVGGLSNIFGAVLGGYVIGISESLITYNLSSILGSGILLYGKVISLIILVIMLLLAPQGIVGIGWRKRLGYTIGGR
ncbi:MAG: ABC transporter permease subunit [Candidatus Syntropharchaeia archaeon]